MIDLENQGRQMFFETYIIFKVSHHSYIIYSRFLGFVDLEFVQIYTKSSL